MCKLNNFRERVSKCVNPCTSYSSSFVNLPYVAIQSDLEAIKLLFMIILNKHEIQASILTFMSWRYFFCGSFVLFMSCCLSCFRICSLLPCAHKRDRTDILALVCDVYCDCVALPFGILGQVWHLIVSIPNPCCLSYFRYISCLVGLGVKISFITLVPGQRHSFFCLVCCFTSQVNSYGHCGTVSLPNHTFFLGRLVQAVNQ